MDKVDNVDCVDNTGITRVHVVHGIHLVHLHRPGVQPVHSEEAGGQAADRSLEEQTYD